ncbi:unnamed protein product [Babesia microti strain RI]|uniref:Uncharacterized protein n=1 Tax=Babesia microti (strain RI) TaxID=1133968 RepID=A0A1N6LWS0_BABMR|nr:uncharacterized protein BMR1_01G01741 [Babesia microti strain RI]SIO73313.1 unnamed protein product [Babesia microti strain RI]|eukprot:XP_021337415.1 uncharacterized protein BMR1_01G01741 [Babesia microti strain RI]
MVCMAVIFLLPTIFTLSPIHSYNPPLSFNDLLTRPNISQAYYSVKLQEPETPDNNSQTLTNLSEMLYDLRKEEANEIASFTAVIQEQNKTLKQINKIATA